jgi:hypothetical protein
MKTALTFLSVVMLACAIAVVQDTSSTNSSSSQSSTTTTSSSTTQQTSTATSRQLGITPENGSLPLLGLLGLGSLIAGLSAPR